MKILNYLIPILGVIALTAHADVTGNYQCKGTDPFTKDAANYSNPLKITKNGDTYAVQWLHSNGYPYIYGTGVMHKDLPNVFSVVFWDPASKDYMGVQQYQIMSDGSLQATWTLKATDKTGTENCTKQ